MRKKFLSLLIFIVTIATSISIAATLDIKIKRLLRDTVGSISGFIGAAVVNADTGELMGSYILYTRAAEAKYKMAALITNIVRDAQKAGETTKFHPLRIDITLDNNQRILISLISKDFFVGCRYKSYAPIGLAKYQLRKLRNRLEYLLQ
jgi:predicted regulator of Ras-like GTPase activity (Roadblock/LC7/MglB family)